MIKLGSYEVKPTIFPDGTSQVWNIPEYLLQSQKTIDWYFENESELIHVLQLAKLIEYARQELPNLHLPYFPYARQDKAISNNTTFARVVFMQTIAPFFDRISTVDIHSPCDGVVSIPVDARIKEVIEDSNAQVICFPDKGASLRKYNIQGLPYLILDKVRNQLTGDIEKLKIHEEFTYVDFRNKNVLLVDDLIDAGRTFIEAAKILYNFGAKNVSLYTTHGLYTKGVSVLFEAGIHRVYCINKDFIYNNQN